MSSVMTMMLYFVPTLIVYTAGIVMSLMTWRRHSTVSLLALCGFGLLLLGAILSALLQLWVTSNFWEIDPEKMHQVFTIFSGFHSLLLSPVAFGFLLAAIFRRRRQKVDVWEA